MPKLIVGIILIAAFAIYKFVQNSRVESLRKQVEWVTSTNDGWDGPRGLQLWQYVYNVQIKKSIPQKYRITQSEDWVLVRSIIKECTDKVGKDYLDRRLEPSAEYAALTPEEFFFAKFYYYLYIEAIKHDRICGKDIYTHTDPFVDEFGYDAQKCFLSNAGVVYYKLCYIVAIYCKDNPRINCFKTGVRITGEYEAYKSILDCNYVKTH